MLTRNYIRTIAFIGCLLLGGNAFAEFSVKAMDMGKSDDEALAQASEEYFGNAQTVKFRHAIEGSDMSVAEQIEVSDELPVLDKDTYYVSVRGHLSKQRLTKIENASSSGSSFKDLNVSEKNLQRHERGFDIAVGYMWDNTRTEIQYILTKDMNYNPSEAFVGNGNALTGELSNNTFLFNFYYDFLEHLIFRPYVFGGVGLGMNKTTTTFNGSNGSKTRYDLAWAVGAGARFKLLERIYLDAAYRYAHLGRFNFYNGQDVKLKGDYKLSGVSLGLLFLF